MGWTHVSRYRKCAVFLVALLVSTVVGRAEAQSLSSSEAYALAKRGRLVIIDVRSPIEWSRTGVPVGARPVDKDLPLDALIAEVDRFTGGDKTKRLGIICLVGVRSFEVRADLEVAGYHRVIDIFDGIDGNANGPGWLASGLPLRSWPPR
jgi:rhodanese-related sulfurtransferase